MNSLEYNVTWNYLDWLRGIPWGLVSEENFDICEAQKVLNQDHYGMDNVKDTILEFIAVGESSSAPCRKILVVGRGCPEQGKCPL